MINGLVIIVAISFLASTSAKRIIQVEPEQGFVYVSEGDNHIHLLCKTNTTIDNCKVTIPGEESVNLAPHDDITGLITYYGAGLDKGECGAQILEIKPKHNGKFDCAMKINGKEEKANINIIVLNTPRRTKLEILNSTLVEGSELNITCSSSDGRPKANLVWYIGENEITEGLGEEIVETKSNGLATVKQVYKKIVTIDDDRQIIKCRAYHPGFREHEFKENSARINVYYPPQLIDEQELFHEHLHEFRNLSFYVKIKANPKPNIEWHFGDEEVIHEGEGIGRHASSILEMIRNNTYMATLKIYHIQEKDVVSPFTLHASNPYGSEIYNVTLVLQEYNPWLSRGAIIGYIIVSLIVLSGISVVASAAADYYLTLKPPKHPPELVIDPESLKLSEGQNEGAELTKMENKDSSEDIRIHPYHDD